MKTGNELFDAALKKEDAQFNNAVHEVVESDEPAYTNEDLENLRLGNL